MEWFFTKNGKQEGPISTESLQSMIVSGAVATTDLIWREGMAEWTPAGQVAEFAGGGDKLVAACEQRNLYAN